MAKYTIISDIGKGILGLLRDKLVPDPVDSAASIGICEPKDRGGYIVGIHPYDIREDTSGTAKEPTLLPDGSVQDPPALIELNYSISVCSKAELEAKALDEARIMGKIIQVIKDNPVIPARYMPDNMGMPVENVPISMLPLNMEEKVKVWTMFGESYKLSVFYVVGPVAIDSGNIHESKRRVNTIYLGSEQFERRKEIRFSTHIKDEDIDDEYTQRPDEDELEDEGTDGDDLGTDGDDLGTDGDDLGADDDDLGTDGDDLGADDDDLGTDGDDLGADGDDLGADGDDLGADGDDLGTDGDDLGTDDDDLGADGDDFSFESSDE